ncbi:MAG: acyltransferase [Lentisphaerae bacterium]|nr:acyltransferase [Lentisphaerota bacterium]
MDDRRQEPVSRWRSFVERYDGPLHLPVIAARIAGLLSVAWWTARAVAALRFCGCRPAPGLRADGKVVIRMARRDSVRIGRGVRLVSRPAANPVGLNGPVILHCIGDGRIEIGEGSGLSSAVVSSRSSVVIGRNTLVGGNARIFDHDFHSLDWRDRRDRRADEAACATTPVRIGDDVLIGTGALILKGTTIGDRSVIGAGSVVTGTVPPDEVWAGNPARRIRSLRE